MDTLLFDYQSTKKVLYNDYLRGLFAADIKRAIEQARVDKHEDHNDASSSKE